MTIDKLGQNQANSVQMPAGFVGHGRAERMMQCLEGVDVNLNFPPLHDCSPGIFALGMVDAKMRVSFFPQRMIGSPIVAEDNGSGRNFVADV